MAQYYILSTFIVFVIGLIMVIFGRKNKIIWISGLIISVVTFLILAYIFLMGFGT